MRSLLLSLGTFLLIGSPLHAQESSSHEVESKTSPEASQSFMVTITEYQLTGAIATSGTVQDIVDHLIANPKSDSVRMVETIRMRMVSQAESLVQFGRQVEVVAGVVTGRTGTSRSMQSIQVGTIVRIESNYKGGNSIGVTFDYEASRLGEQKGDSRPAILSTQVSGTQSIEFGTPTLIGASTAGDSSFIIMTITK